MTTKCRYLLAVALIAYCHAKLIAGDQPDGGYIVTYGEIKRVGDQQYSLQIKQKTVRRDELLKDLSDPDRETRLDAIRAIARKGKLPKQDSPALIKALGAALKDKEISVRYNAVEVLSDLGPDCVAVLPAMIEMMKEKEALVRGQTIRAIAQLGPDAKPAIPAFVVALSDEQHLVAGLASHALGEIGAAAVPALVDALKSPEPNARTEAVHALAMIGPAAKEAVQPLKQLVAGSDQLLSYKARQAIEDIEETPGRAVRIYSRKASRNPQNSK
jgi:HEAT repeat protein